MLPSEASRIGDEMLHASPQNEYGSPWLPSVHTKIWLVDAGNGKFMSPWSHHIYISFDPSAHGGFLKNPKIIQIQTCVIET